MIKIDEKNIVINGSPDQILHEFTVLVHAFNDSVFPKFDNGEKLRQAEAFFLASGAGLEELQNQGIIGGFNERDLSNFCTLMNVIKEGGDNDAG